MSVANTYGRESVDADRGTDLNVVDDPSAYLGISGHDDPTGEVEVTNNTTTTDLRVTVESTNFTIENDGDGPPNTDWEFTLAAGTTQLVDFFQENGNQDTVRFTADILDASGTVTGSIDLTRTLTIPAEPDPGTEYRIENVNSGMVMGIESECSNGSMNPGGNCTGGGELIDNVVQFGWDSSDDNLRWNVLDNGDGTVRLEHVGSGEVLSIHQNPDPGDSTVSLVVRNWTGNDDDQRWNLIFDDDGRYLIESDGNPGEVADVEGNSESAGADVIRWPTESLDDTGDVPDNQRWIIESV